MWHGKKCFYFNINVVKNDDDVCDEIWPHYVTAKLDLSGTELEIKEEYYDPDDDLQDKDVFKK